MVHSLRKYLNNRGSALFMVLSTMTALMITCMAMYFAVVSSRTAQFAVFNQQQSYQSARSISDIIRAGLQNDTLKTSDGKKSLQDEVNALSVGQSLSTNGNGFTTFDPTSGAKLDDDYLGAYDVTITRLNDQTINEKGCKVYDIAVTTSVNGVRETTHTQINVAVETAQGAPATDVFRSTGYTDQNVYIDAGKFLTDMVFDNQDAVINAYLNGGFTNQFLGNLTACGSLQINGYVTPNPDSAVVWAIRNKLYESPDRNFPVNFSSTSSTKSTVLIGGDLDMGESWAGISNADIYVNGDFYYGQSNFSNSRLFVHGNVYVRTTWRNLSSFPIYCDGEVIEIEGGRMQGSIKGTWEDNDNLPSGVMTRHNAMTMLDDLTADPDRPFYKWEINDKYKKIRVKENGKWVETGKDDPTYVPELDETRGTDVHKTLHWSLSSDNPIPVVTLTYGVDGKGCIIDDTTVERGNNSFYDMTLIIDTGDDPDNVYTIRVKPNRDFDGDGKEESFSWNPLEQEILTASDPRFKVLVKGRGSVVIDIPEGVIYQETTFSKTSHYNWWVLAGGTVDSSRGAGKEVYNDITYSDTLSKFVINDCSNCSYDDEEVSQKCENCNKKMVKYSCTYHGYEFTCCPDCQSYLIRDDACKHHVDKKAIDKYLDSNPSVKARMEKDSGGEIIYPTTNLFLVSVDENADIRFSITKGGENVGLNTFFGFIYAPYMTFKGYGENAAGGVVRFFGGATVSDFIFQDNMTFVTCYPDKMPEDIMSKSCRSNPLPVSSKKKWKISLGSY